MADFSLHAGDSLILDVPVVDEATGEPLDLTDAQAIRWQLARSVKHPALVEKAVGSGVQVQDAPGGLVAVTLAPADTVNLSGRYYHEVEVIDAQGHVCTVLAGYVLIRPALIPPASP